MRSILCLLLALPLLWPALASPQEARSALRGVSSIRIANYNQPSTIINAREQLNAIVGELNQLRRKSWKRGDAKIACYATMVLLQGTRRVGEFRIRTDLLVERPVERGQATYNLDVAEADLPAIASLLAAIPPAKDCN
jgi:hypothetical protein